MTLLQCGCSDDARFRCDEHKDWLCHGPDRYVMGIKLEFMYCPPCRIAKWRSVSLSSAATPTRRGKLL